MSNARGDRVKESRRLNKPENAREPSLEAFWAYSHWLNVLPDDFGRFRANLKLISSALAPRRKDVTERVCGRILAEFVRVELVKIWEHDGERFGEFNKFKVRGNKYHRTPEPPGSPHLHSGACAASAMLRAKDWGFHDEAARLSLFIKDLRDRRQSGANKDRNTYDDPSTESEGSVPRARPSPPSSPFSPSSPRQQQEESARVREANPLADRHVLISEGNALIREIAPLADLDPTEVLSKASEWKGKSYVRLDTMPEDNDRLIHTVNALRGWLRKLKGEPEPALPLPPARASPEPRGQLSKVVEGMRRAQEVRETRDAQPKSLAGRTGESQRLLPSGEQEPE